MNYYVLDSNDEIALFDTDKSRLKTTLKFKPDLSNAKIHQTTREIVELDGKFVFADEHTEDIENQETQAKITELRAKRDADLARTDFYLMPDYPISEENLELIKAYRQALRDLPQQEGFPYVEYPVDPLAVTEVEEK